ncbi:DUF3616 domain-containing protein [Massilia violaceinigra]|uniref:DUF3616 domain-containing protein n=1 Tax=Massilia violaceinigra TaxID=2045208 RepID=A0ABY4A821_9BURK|nr:DUF3616 domain-containing protein [Massilia violaceinigra]UOD30823.1 DUF3616 domain-containing protein [Massilia violaceinigra]
MTQHKEGTSATLIADALHARLEDHFTYRGMCDASAAAALGEDLFVVANDERNQLKIYQRGVADAVEVVDLSDFLGTRKNKESDLEGAATIGERIYWITSHGRNKKGEVQERRFRFFATEAGKRNGKADGKDGARLQPVGKAYSGLLDDMIASEQLKKYPLAQASGMTPEADGAFNIEGLAATPEGTLLIGLRNPAPEGKALVVHLLNPEKVVEGGRAEFGEAFELDLGGMAIRSMELVGLAYMIVAGPPADHGEFALYRWSGKAGDAPEQLVHEDFDDVRPEALFAIPGTRKVQILSDDGGPHVKEMAEEEQTFRSITVVL